MFRVHQACYHLGVGKLVLVSSGVLEYVTMIRDALLDL